MSTPIDPEQYSRLPTLDKLGVPPPDAVDAPAVAAAWFASFAPALEAHDLDAVLALLTPDALWRDILALTWDFRTLDGAPAIRALLAARLPEATPRAVKPGALALFQRPFPDLAWVLATFTLATRAGPASGVVRLVPTPAGWRAATLFTNLEDLAGFPERIGPHRRATAQHGTWAAERAREAAFADADPAVLVVGGGHCGLEVAARLKYLDVPTLVIEKHPRVGDSWRERYNALCLHWPIWFDHMPYIPFPPTWPKYTPSLKMADWLETYAHALELNVWTSATATAAAQDADGTWRVTVVRADGRARVFRVRHLVFAAGIGDAFPNVPTFPGADAFAGAVLHSSRYRSAAPYAGKRVVVVGAGNSGHDVAGDLAAHGVDVTMVQRGPTFVMNLDRQWKFLGGPLYSEGAPPTDVADRLFASMPHALQEGGLAQRATRAIEAGDKELLDGLRAAGFKLSHGIKDTGILLLLKTRGGGHYFDVGASQLIIDGKIKLKNDSAIARFGADALVFEDGSALPADAVIFATGLGDLRAAIGAVCGPAVAAACKPISGVDADGELRGAWRDLGVRGLWYMMGSLQMARFHSKHLALQIKAMEEGVFGTRYSLEEEAVARA